MRNTVFFHNLTPDDRQWRIDWFGEVKFPGQIERSSQSSFKVSISPLVQPLDSRRTNVAIESNIDEQRHVWMPISALATVRINDVWQRGVRIPDRHLFANIARAFDVDTAESDFVKAGLPIGGSYLLPFDEHPWHRGHTQSYCIAVSAQDGVTLIIPCLELIRFYFGTSTAMLHTLFRGPLHDGALWLEKTFDEQSRHLHLKLPDWIPPLAAADIGRIANSETAFRAAADVYGNCAKASAVGQAAYPYVRFPFQGKTTLRVLGRPLSFAGSPKKNFLVYQLKSCSYPLPFKSLTWEESAQRVIRRAQRREEAKSESARRRKLSHAELDERDPGRQRLAGRYTYDDDLRFSDLKHKRLWREDAVRFGASDVFMRHADGSIERVAYGDPHGARDVRAIDHLQAEPAPRLAPDDVQLPQFVKDGMQLAFLRLPRGGSGFRARPLIPFGAEEPVLPLPVVLDEDGVVDTVTDFIEPNGHRRQRRVCFLGFYRGDEEDRKVVIVEGVGVAVDPIVATVESTDHVLVVDLLH